MIRETTAELPHVISTRARAEDQPRLLANVQRGWRTFDVTCAEGVFHLNLFPAEMKPDLPCEPLLLDAYAHACAQGETPALYFVQVFSDEELAQLPLEPERLSYLHLLWDDGSGHGLYAEHDGEGWNPKPVWARDLADCLDQIFNGD